MRRDDRVHRVLIIAAALLAIIGAVVARCDHNPDSLGDPPAGLNAAGTGPAPRRGCREMVLDDDVMRNIGTGPLYVFACPDKALTGLAHQGDISP